MYYRYLYRNLLFVALVLPFSLFSQVIDLGPVPAHCASDEEVKLYNLITEYRQNVDLPPIPFSRSLSYTARVHAMDLSFNRPDFGGCNPHSWSAKGKWKPCCYAHDLNRLVCMNEKPKEITGYKFKAWEMVYSGGEEARAADAFELWIGLGLTKDYIVNSGKWLKPWKSIGIGFYGEYATVWFGEGTDLEKDFGPCSPDSINTGPVATRLPDREIAADTIMIAPQSDNRYHIITGSLNTLDKAGREVLRLQKLGYSHARLIQSGNNFRISVNNYPGEAEAQRALHALMQVFPGAWVLKPGQ